MNKTIIQSEYALNAQSVLQEDLGITTWIVWEGAAPIVPYETNTYTLERISKFELESTTPREVLNRIEALERRGFEYDCILIAHEKKPFKGFQMAEGVSDAFQRAIPVLASILAALVILVAVTLTIAAFLSVLLPILLVGVALYAMTLCDPAVILVLKDGSWLLIARWDE